MRENREKPKEEFMNTLRKDIDELETCDEINALILGIKDGKIIVNSKAFHGTTLREIIGWLEKVKFNLFNLITNEEDDNSDDRSEKFKTIMSGLFGGK